MLRYLKDWLMLFLESNNKFTPHQYSIQPGGNTIDPLAALTTDTHDGFNDSKTSTAIFFDLEKGYDKSADTLS